MKKKKRKVKKLTAHTAQILHDTIETLEITIRTARRCAYDLKHCSDALVCSERHGRHHRDDETAQMFRERADFYVRLFQNGNSMKDYRLKLHGDLDDANDTITKLRAILAEHKLDDPTQF